MHPSNSHSTGMDSLLLSNTSRGRAPANIFTTYITPSIVAHSLTAASMSAAFTGLAIVIDIIGYALYCAAANNKLPSPHETLNFAYIPFVGSFVIGSLAWLAFVRSDLLIRLQDENEQWAKGVMRLTVTIMLVLDDLLGLLIDYVILEGKRLELINICWRSKLTSLGLVLILGMVFISQNGEKRFATSLAALYQDIELRASKMIGPGTGASENGCVGLLTCCCSSMYNTRDSQYTGLNEHDDTSVNSDQQRYLNNGSPIV